MDKIEMMVKLNLLKYFERNGVMEMLERSVNDFAEKLVAGQIDLHQTFYFPFRVNVIEMGQNSDLLIREPLITQRIANEVALTSLGTALQHRKMLQIEQIESPIVVAPPFPLSGVYLEPGLTSFIGVIAECTDVQKFIRTSRWKCAQSSCISKDPQILKGLPMRLPICRHCAAPLEEVPTFRYFGNKWKLKLIPEDSLRDRTKCFHRWLEGCVEDDRNLDGVLRLGDEVVVSGVFNNGEIFEIWGLQQVIRKPSGPLPTSIIEKIRSQLDGNAWAFVKVLAASIGRSFIPEGMLMQLRIGLILSLASVNFRPPIPILAICDDDDPVQRLMREALRLTARCTRPVLDNNLAGVYSNGWLQAGSLQLASRGVCFLGHWERYVGKKGQAVRDAVVSGRITLPGGVYFEPLHTAIWTYCSRPNRKTINQVQTLLKVFGLAWRVESDLASVEDATDLVLGITQYRELIPLREIRDYLASIISKPVELTDGATDLLKQYFTCSRIARRGMLPLTSLDPLRALTEAHARLNKRISAFPEDALAAIELCEKALGPIPEFPQPPEETYEFATWLQNNVLAISTQFSTC